MPELLDELEEDELEDDELEELDDDELELDELATVPDEELELEPEDVLSEDPPQADNVATEPANKVVATIR